MACASRPGGVVATILFGPVLLKVYQGDKCGVGGCGVSSDVHRLSLCLEWAQRSVTQGIGFGDGATEQTRLQIRAAARL